MAEISVPEKFNLPFYKLQISQVNKCKYNNRNEDWIAVLETGKEISCHMVWVQGTVESVSADRESASLSDGKGSSIRLLNLSTTPGNISRSYLAPMIFFLFIGCSYSVKDYTLFS